MIGRHRVVFLGSGAFGEPTLRALHAAYEIPLVVSQPDRPAGRGRRLEPTPIARCAETLGLPIFRPEDPNAPDAVAAIHGAHPDALVVIAYGHKLRPALLEGMFAINLHASLLPRWRGAAPINRAMMAGDAETGVSVIALAQRMDAGAVHARRAVPIDPHETAGELHDRLAALGPEAVLTVLAAHFEGREHAEGQDEAVACPAPKLRKEEGTVDFALPAPLVRARIHGLNPWPGCTVRHAGGTLRILRCADVGANAAGPPGAIDDEGVVTCGAGAVRLLEVQAPGSRTMTWRDFRNGHALPAGTTLQALEAAP